MKYIVDGIKKTEEQFKNMLTDELVGRCFEVIDLTANTVVIKTYPYRNDIKMKKEEKVTHCSFCGEDTTPLDGNIVVLNCEVRTPKENTNGVVVICAKCQKRISRLMRI